MNAVRDALKDLMPRRGAVDSHPGLLLQRYLHESAAGDNGKPEHKQQILQAAINASRNREVRELYNLAFGRWQKSLPESTVANDLQTVGRLIVGLGTENVLETGIRLHHTYGMPILPGSALKGLAAHYCDQVLGPMNNQFKRPTKSEDEAYRKFLAGKGEKPEVNVHRLLFGTSDDSGCIVFHDAWFVPDSENEPLKLDVMTPHHPKWLDGSVAPTDFDSPVPVPFLSVTGTFHVAVSWHWLASDRARNWTELALSILCDALNDWGIGGKTTSGYGRLRSNSGTSRQELTQEASAQSMPTRTPAPPAKRASGTAVTVQIVGRRAKGFDVQEEGRPQGTLTVGNKPAEIPANIGDNVDVEIHVDHPKRPQYRWPTQKPTKRGPDQGKSRR